MTVVEAMGIFMERLFQLRVKQSRNIRLWKENLNFNNEG